MTDLDKNRCSTPQAETGERLSVARFTPGPWRIGRGLSNQGEWPILGPDYRVALVTCITDFAAGKGWSTECPERDANARLIAAAPDLYAALLDILHWADPYSLPGVDRHEASIERAQAAIDKASPPTGAGSERTTSNTDTTTNTDTGPKTNV